jgi:hypothetical protein
LWAVVFPDSGLRLVLVGDGSAVTAGIALAAGAGAGFFFAEAVFKNSLFCRAATSSCQSSQP